MATAHIFRSRPQYIATVKESLHVPPLSACLPNGGRQRCSRQGRLGV